MEGRKMYKLLMKNENCALLESLERKGRYKVRDIENEDIYIGNNYDNALKMFNDYDIKAVRRMRKRLFEDWLKEFVQA